jgi:hypothetical protein
MSGGGKHGTTLVSDDQHIETTKQSAQVKVTDGGVIATAKGVPAVSAQDVAKIDAEQSTQTEQEEQKDISLQGLDDKSVDDLLLMARESYWNNGLDEAAAIYQQLIQREPQVVAHKGELGNVYWRQGFPEKSARLYAEIAVPMINNGQADRVSNMVGFIALFHPEKAAAIEKQLQGLRK